MVARTIRLNVVASSPIGGIAGGLTSGQFTGDIAASLGVNTPVGYDGSASNAPLRAPFVAENSGGPYNLSDWTGKGHWDDVRKEWWYCAGTTGEASGSMTLIRYSEANNNWRHWQGASYLNSGVFGAGQAHNFESAAFDQGRGKIYRLLNDPTYGRSVGVFDVATQTGTKWAASSISINGYWAMEAFPEASALCVFYPNGNTTIKRLSLDTGAALADWSKPATSNNSCTCYYNGRLYFTGDNGAFYAKEINGSTTTLASSATAFNANGNDSLDHAILAQIGGYLYAFKVSTGATGRGIYRYDPLGNSWSTMTTSIPFATRTGGARRETRFMVAPIRSQGVALIVTPSDDAGFLYSAFLWKP